MGSIPGVLQSGRPTIGCNLSDPKRAQTPKRCFQLGPTSEKFGQLFALKQNLWVEYNLLTIVCKNTKVHSPKENFWYKCELHESCTATRDSYHNNWPSTWLPLTAWGPSTFQSEDFVGEFFRDHWVFPPRVEYSDSAVSIQERIEESVKERRSSITAENGTFSICYNQDHNWYSKLSDYHVWQVTRIICLIINLSKCKCGWPPCLKI